MYNAKSYVNYINNTIIKNAKSGCPHLFYYCSETGHKIFVVFSHTTHFIYYADLTAEARAIVDEEVKELPKGRNIITSLAFGDSYSYDRSIEQLALSKEYEPAVKSGIKRLLCFTNSNGKCHYLNKSLLTKYGKLHTLALFSSPCSSSSTVFVFRDNGIGREPEYLGAIAPVKPTLIHWREVTD